jgi:hypothetical protein
MSLLRIAGVALILVFLAVPGIRADGLPVFGYLEKVRVGPTDLVMRAKLDTGADTSSLGYSRIDFFNKDGARWVRLEVTNIDGQSVEIERRIVRMSSIKRHNAPNIERPVVRVRLCLGGISSLTEVTLADRSGFSVPILIGRSFLAGAAIVDSSREYTTTPDCKDKAKDP